MGISSPLLKQAGFAKSKIFTAIAWVAVPDGLSQYWQLTSPIAVKAGAEIEISFIGGTPSNAYGKFIESASNRSGIDAGSTSSFFRVRFGTATLNDEPGDINQDPIPTSGENKLILTPSEDTTFETIGSRGSGELMNLPLYMLRVRDLNGVLTNEIPLTNKSQGETQSPTVGDVSAVMANFTAAVWKDKSNL
ncbi:MULTISPECIES: hypothetical protein [unclassified Pseudoalteromonas]|uniref:hypothetical protein n=1 Tax=unclassified Pseudoalteromonas TaxID=194690 RepID=UPI0015F9C585|nr:MULTISPECIES: hypothetical protein [unclassified Pseudoalteromonas]MBB1290968.1 hypothetical protein [Pseudoalteromonas sp. SR41-5]MBB1415330.1 hypothetical protein [Pseudoalteromonas sp. SG43-8]